MSGIVQLHRRGADAFSSTAGPGAVAAGTPVGTASLLRRSPFYVAHRGGSADWPEMTLYAYAQALAWNPGIAIEVSVHRSADGVWVCNHNPTTGDVFDRDLPIATTRWATLSALRSKSGSQPIARFDDVLARYAGTVPMLVDNKMQTATAAWLDLLDARGGPAWFIVKGYYTKADEPLAALARGYTTWGYYYGAEYAAEPGLLARTQTRWSMLGLDVEADEAIWDAFVATGKKLIGHTPATLAAGNLGLRKGASGLMCASVRDVVPKT